MTQARRSLRPGSGFIPREAKTFAADFADEGRSGGIASDGRGGSDESREGRLTAGSSPLRGFGMTKESASSSVPTRLCYLPQPPYAPPATPPKPPAASSDPAHWPHP